MKIKFKAIRFLPNRSQLSFFAKWLTKEVTAGLVVAAAIALATLWINNYQARQKEKLQLEKLHLGLSSQYIDSILGIPMVQFYDAHYDADISIYKQSNSVVWCAYDEEKTVAYVVIVKSSGRCRSKFCIACSDLFYKSECTHAATPSFQTASTMPWLPV